MQTQKDIITILEYVQYITKARCGIFDFGDVLRKRRA